MYVSFVTDCQRGRLLGSKSLEQLPNREHKICLNIDLRFYMVY